MTDQDNEIEELAKQLHDWYLEITSVLSEKSFNKEAQKSFDNLTNQQQAIDKYIAKKILELFNQSRNDLLDKIIGELPEGFNFEEDPKDEWEHASWVGANRILDHVRKLLEGYKGD